MDGKLFISQLVQGNLLDKDVGNKLLQEASLSRRLVEDLIYERRLVPEMELLKTKSQLIKVPYKAIAPEEIPDNLLALIPEETVRNYHVVPLEKTDDLLIVGMVHPDDQRAQEALKFIAKQLKVNAGVYLVSPSVWETVLRRYSPYRSEVDAAVKSLVSFGGKKLAYGQKVVQIEAGITGGEEAPIIRLVASTFKEAVWQKASDIHFEPQRNRMRVRFRIDGELIEVASLPIELHQPVVSRIKVLSNLKIDETRISQDGRFRTVLLGRDIDFRVSTFPTPVGEKIALRVLDPTVGLKGLEELGLLGGNLQIVKNAVARPYGMVLITGPTGSGKTTTLYALMQTLNRDTVNIVSLEDPVEYYMDGLNQSQVHPEIGYDFASGLRQILRQDPDIIMVGEIRDNETAGLAVHAALTGHVVLSTLHTNNAVGVIPRLVDMKVDSFLIPAALNLMVAQRLIPRLCRNCLQEKELSDEVKKELDRQLKDMEESVKKEAGISSSYTSYESKGCEVCKGKGVSGRVALFEIFQMTRQLEEIIGGNHTEADIITEAKRQKMITLRQDGILKAFKGMVSLEVVLRETEEL